MPVEDNKAMVRRFFEEVINGSDLDRAGEFVTRTTSSTRASPAAGALKASRSPSGFCR
jgi:hypothetical protein